MKFQAQIKDEEIDVEVKRDGNSVVAVVAGRRYELEVSEPESNVFLFNHEGRVYEASVSKTKDGSSQIRVGAHEFDITLIDPKRLRGSGAGAAHADGIAEIKSAMPGKVVRILVEPGAEVESGAGVLIVEAMKMQNELKAPKAGTIKDIKVQEGAAVGAGDVLVTIE